MNQLAAPFEQIDQAGAAGRAFEHIVRRHRHPRYAPALGREGSRALRRRQQRKGPRDPPPEQR